MLSPIILQLLNSAESKMNGYFALLDYRYKNLCTKAEAASMLPIEVEMEGASFKIENVAAISIPEWNQIMVIPKDEDYIPYIGHAVIMVHPEFKQKVTRYHVEELNKDIKVLLLTVPPVDKDRKKVLDEGTDSLYDQCLACLDKTKVDTGLAIAKGMANKSKEEIDEARNKFDELYKQYRKNVDQLHDDKKQEIEEAYEKYVKEQGESKSEALPTPPEVPAMPDVTQSIELPK